MPRIGTEEQGEQFAIGGGNFTFSGASIENLVGATEYTLVTIAVDVTGSTNSFADKLRAALVEAVVACKKSPRADNLMLRVVTFNSIFGVEELHGFVPLSDVDPADYPTFQPDGLTPLMDAAYSSIGAMVTYGAELAEKDFFANGIAFIITDGADNASTVTPRMIREFVEDVRVGEKLESLISVLIGINTAQYSDLLEAFQREAGIDSYIDVDEATKGKLAKLAQFVSRSVSSQSQALGTGGPSQNISATI